MSIADKPPGLGNRIAPARFVAFFLVALVAVPAAMAALGPLKGILVGFDVAALTFLASCLSLLGSSDTGAMRLSAARNDANRALLLAVTVAVSLVILVAIAAELMHGQSPDATGIAIVMATLFLCWLFSNVVYALHYAHLFYSASADGKDTGGLDIPGVDEPDYHDFLYFSITLGMTFQTSDTEITGAAVRHVAIGHCLAAFWFNVGVLAFTINVLGS